MIERFGNVFRETEVTRHVLLVGDHFLPPVHECDSYESSDYNEHESSYEVEEMDDELVGDDASDRSSD